MRELPSSLLQYIDKAWKTISGTSSGKGPCRIPTGSERWPQLGSRLHGGEASKCSIATYFEPPTAIYVLNPQ